MQRFIENMGKLGLTHADPKTMQPLTAAQMEQRDRDELRKSYAGMPSRRLLVRDGQDTMITDIAFAAAEQALTTLSERLASAPLTLAEKNTAGILAMLMLAAHHASLRDALLLNIGLLAGLASTPELELDGTESMEQLLAKLDALTK